MLLLPPDNPDNYRGDYWCNRNQFSIFIFPFFMSNDLIIISVKKKVIDYFYVVK